MTKSRSNMPMKPKPENTGSKDGWDKIAAITPLLLGLAVTGVGAIFTQIYNYRQLQLTQIEALDKLRPLLTSEKPEEREFGYASFAALGYENIAIRIVKLKKDESGRALLEELKTSASPETRAQATDALTSLNQAKRLVNINELGRADPTPQMLLRDPNYVKALDANGQWAQTTAKDLGLTTALGVAIIYDAAVHHGPSRAKSFCQDASKQAPPPLKSLDEERVWLEAFLTARETILARMKTAQPSYARFYPGWMKRISRLRSLLTKEDWQLKTIEDL